MKRQFFISAAGLLVGASLLIGCDRNQSASNTNTGTTPGQRTSDSLANAGQKTANGVGEAVDNAAASTQPSADAAIKDTRKTLASAVEDAVTNNDFNKLVRQFTKADRDRIGKVSDDSLANLNAAIGQFRRDWKAKYNQDFKLTDKEEVVFGTPVSIEAGGQGEANLAAATTGPEEAAAKLNAERANNVTTVNFPKSDAAPAVSLTLQNEGTVMREYKIKVPDTLDATKLQANLIKHINDVDQMKDKWPSDVNEAARIVSQHVLKAISETDANASASIQ